MRHERLRACRYSEAEGWEFEDAELRHRNAPDLDLIPPLAERTDESGNALGFTFIFGAATAID